MEFEGKNFQAGTAYGLSGKIGSTSAGYKDGVVTITETGTMKQLLGNDFLNITSLKVVGPINGDDVRFLRQMLGCSEFNNVEKGKLNSLDLSEASIVQGGGTYYDDYCTSDDVIGDYMFNDCANLLDIVLPDSVTSIGDYAFAYCSSLTSIDIPASVTSIGYEAFECCNFLKSVHITDLSAWCNITFSNDSSNPLSYGAKLYLNNKELAELVIPEDIKRIKDYAFIGYKELKKVTIGEGSHFDRYRVFQRLFYLDSGILSGHYTAYHQSIFCQLIFQWV